MTLPERRAWLGLLGATPMAQSRALRLLLSHARRDQMSAGDLTICREEYVRLTGGPFVGAQCSASGCVHGAYLRNHRR